MSKRNETIAENPNVGNDDSNSDRDLSVVSNSAIRTNYRHKPPPFVEKLYAMVVDPETNDIISWSLSKQSFIIWNRNMFISSILPKYFRHCNFPSFSCQLKAYGFNKINWVHYEYANPLFVEGREDLLIRIRKKIENMGVIGRRGYTHDRSLMEAALEILRSEQMELEKQSEELRGKQEDHVYVFSMIGGDIKATIEDQERLNTELIAHLVHQSVIQHLKDHHEDYGIEEPAAKILHLVNPDNKSSWDYPDQEDPTRNQTKVEPVSTPSNDSGRPTQGQKIINDDSAYWKMILEDD